MLGNWRTVYYGLLLLVGLFVLTTPYPFFYSTLMLERAVYLLVIAGALRILILLYRARPERPAAFLFERRSEAWAFLVERGFVFLSSVFFFTWLPPLKALIPSFGGFWADPYLIEADRWLLGDHGFHLLHRLTPDGALPLIDLGYSAWPVVVIAAFAGIAAFASEAKLARFALSWAFSWILLGFLAAVAMASAGPIFGPDLGFGFHDVHEKLDGTIAMQIKDMLWLVHSTESLRLGGGISAAPSLHCAIAFLMVYAAWRTAWFVPAVLYSLFIWFGSVYLGWHYALDGLLSLFGTAAIWKLSARLQSALQPGVEPQGLPAVRGAMA